MALRSNAMMLIVALTACTGGVPVIAASPAAMPARAAASHDEGQIAEILRSDAELAASVASAERLRLQVSLIAVDGAGALTRSGFRVDEEYFYPASAVKLCAAQAALEKLGELRDELGPSVSPRTHVRFAMGQGRSRRVVTTTLQLDVEQALVVSNNDAFNRLLDFVGPEELAERMTRRGITSARITQHLGDVTAWSEPVIELLLPRKKAVPVSQRIGFPLPPPVAVSLGNAHVDEHGRRVPQPMDFGSKNAIHLRDLQDLLIGIVRPDLTADPSVWEMPYRAMLVETLGLLPSELDGIRATKARALDPQLKPIDVAIAGAFPNEDIRVYGKGGRAYGFAIENAYVTSQKSGRSFFLALAMYANENDTMNDDRYEYGAVANPFVTRLAVVLARQLLVTPATATVDDDVRAIRYSDFQY